jgi:hypothetical protein
MNAPDYSQTSTRIASTWSADRDLSACHATLVETAKGIDKVSPCNQIDQCANAYRHSIHESFLFP